MSGKTGGVLLEYPAEMRVLVNLCGKGVEGGNSTCRCGFRLDMLRCRDEVMRMNASDLVSDHHLLDRYVEVS